MVWYLRDETAGTRTCLSGPICHLPCIGRAVCLHLISILCVPQWHCFQFLSTQLSDNALSDLRITLFVPQDFSRCFQHIYTTPPSPRLFHVTQSSVKFYVNSMKAYGTSRGIAPLKLNLGARLKCVVNITHRPLYHRFSLRYPLNRSLGGPQSLC